MTPLSDPATINRDRREWLAAKIDAARDGYHRSSSIEKLTRELRWLEQEAVRHGWIDAMDGELHAGSSQRRAA